MIDETYILFIKKPGIQKSSEIYQWDLHFIRSSEKKCMISLLWAKMKTNKVVQNISLMCVELYVYILEICVYSSKYTKYKMRIFTTKLQDHIADVWIETLIAIRCHFISGERFWQARGVLQGRASCSGISSDKQRSTRILRGRLFVSLLLL